MIRLKFLIIKLKQIKPNTCSIEKTLNKYKYLTGEDLGYKPDALTQAKFEYSPLGKVFTAGLDKSDKTEGLLKTLKNVENKPQSINSA